MKSYYSNGKLWILGEYYVLAEAKGLALPTKFGQYLKVYPIKYPHISWKSYDWDNSVWFCDTISFDAIFLNTQTSDDKIKNTLISILHHAHLMNPKLLSTRCGFYIETELTFNKNWGLGSSSTLINNIAQWFEVDAFNLLEKSFGGSGFDIACAQHNRPIAFQKKKHQYIVNEVDFFPRFKEHLYFVYLNQKKDSKQAIASFKEVMPKLTNEIVEVSKLTDEIVSENSLDNFICKLKDYEQKLGKLLKTIPIQQELFPDFQGLIKSLGGWGGDFVLVASKKNPRDYFKSKGYEIVFTYQEMIL